MNNIPSNEAKISAQAVAAFANTPNPRLRQVVQSLVRHLHAFASEVELSEEEWLEGIRFLTDTGKKCDGTVRQEFILLSDVIGLSMLVDAINHRACESATETTVFGPFYIAGMPERDYGENMAFTPGEPAWCWAGCWMRQASPLPTRCWMSGRPRRTACTPGRTRNSP